MSFSQGAPTQPLSIVASNVFVTGTSAAGNAFTVQQLGVGNVFSAQTSTGATAMIINPSGNVGIGKTNPAYAMDITGDLNFTGTFRQNGTPYIGSQWTGTTTLYFVGNVGIGTTTPQYRFHVTNPGPVSNIVVETDTNAIGQRSEIRFGIPAFSGTGKRAGITSNTYVSDGSDLQFWTNASGGTASAPQMTVTSTGSVGIGITNPGAVLTVTGGTSTPLVEIHDTSVVGPDYGAYGMVNLVRAADTTKAHVAFIRNGYFTWQLGYISGNNSLGMFPNNFSGTQGTPTMTWSGGNVGINNTTPQCALWVPSTSATTGIGVYNADVAIIIGNTAGSVNSNTGSIQVKAGGSSTGIGTGNYNLTLNPLGGNVGVGVPTGTAFSYTFQVIGNIGASSGIYSSLNTNGGGAVINAQNVNAGSSAYSVMQWQTDTGSAYIFKNSSTRTADGGVKTCTFRNDDGDLRLSAASDSPYIYLKSSNGLVGIGTIPSNASFKQAIYGGDASSTLYGPNTTWSAYLMVGTGSTYCAAGRASVNCSNGNLHIDCATGGYQIYLNYFQGGGAGGTNATVGCYAPFFATGDITAFYSDERLKTKTGTIENALDKVCSLNAFKYIHNEIAKQNGFQGDEVYVGLSAQEVQKVLPEVVARAPFDEGTDYDVGKGNSKTGENYLTLKYERMVPLLVEALKEERHLRCQLEERVVALELAFARVDKATTNLV